MLHDEEFYNIYTGEVLPATKAIQQFYSEPGRGCLDSWTDEWKPTGNMSEEYIDIPDFTKAINI